MFASLSSHRVAAVSLLLSALRVFAQDDALLLPGPDGAALRFAPVGETQWTWVGLTTPGAEAETALSETDFPLSLDGEEVMFRSAWTLASQADDRLVFEQTAAEAPVALRRIFSFGPAPHVVRIETWVRTLEGSRRLTGVGLLDIRVAEEEFRETGSAPASFPLFGRSLFVGLEHVSGRLRTSGRSAHASQTPHTPVGEDWQFVAAAVVGWVPASDCTLLTGEARVRDAFIQYLDTIRVRPADLELHTNTWWSLPVPFAEADVLRHLEALRLGFAGRTGLFFDSFALDLGWSDPHSVWKVAANRFPNEFRTINERLRAAGARLGLWVSPGSAYPEGLDNHWLIANGYEVSPFGPPTPEWPGVACFALGGRYQREFKENLLRLVRDYEIRHVKLDFMAHTCDVATHGHPVGEDSAHAIDAGLADVLDSLRAINPAIVLEPLCAGYPPSPWWITKTPYVLGPYGDDVPYGRVPSPEWMESLISARDIAYRHDQERWLMPTQAVQTIDLVYQSPGQFENLAAMAFGRGRWFISTYLKPELMTAQNWDFLAALVRWARANKQYLVNAHAFGGVPEAREAYGYQFHQPPKDIYCVRNPWIEMRSIELPVCAAVSEPRELRLLYPRRATLARLLPGEAGPVLALGPYETMILETVPLGEEPAPLAEPPAPAFSLAATSEPYVEFAPADPENESGTTKLRLLWSGEFSVAADGTAELCVLVEGDPAVAGAQCLLSLDGRTVQAQTAGSAGQFGAAQSPSPESWQWFLVPVARGPHTCNVFVEAPLERASVGVFLRGLAPATSDPAPAEGPAFPVWRASQRPWSGTLLPLRPYSSEPPAED